MTLIGGLVRFLEPPLAPEYLPSVVHQEIVESRPAWRTVELVTYRHESPPLELGRDDRPSEALLFLLLKGAGFGAASLKLNFLSAYRPVAMATFELLPAATWAAFIRANLIRHSQRGWNTRLRAVRLNG